jgi:hypothetical protein
MSIGLVWLLVETIAACCLHSDFVRDMTAAVAAKKQLRQVICRKQEKTETYRGIYIPYHCTNAMEFHSKCEFFYSLCSFGKSLANILQGRFTILWIITAPDPFSFGNGVVRASDRLDAALASPLPSFTVSQKNSDISQLAQPSRRSPSPPTARLL